MLRSLAQQRGIRALAAALLPFLVLGPTAQADNTAAATASDWQFGGTLYLWGAELDSTTPGGATLNIPFDDVLDNLEMAFMGVLSAQKGKWSFLLDAIYMDLSDGNTFPGPALRPDITRDIDARATLKSWIISPGAGYNFYSDDRNSLEALAGARYVDIEAKLQITLDLVDDPFYTGPRTVKDSFDNTDAIVGFKGRTKLNERWFVGYYVDAGTGDSDFTWQAFGTVGYAFDHVEVIGGYRYLDWDFGRDNNNLLKDLSVSGPLLGANFRF